jgi:hypothetical protein
MCLFQSFNTCHLQALQTRKTGSRRSYINPHRHIESPTAFQTTPTTSCAPAIALRLITPFRSGASRYSRFDWRFLSELQALYTTIMSNQKKSGTAPKQTKTQLNTSSHIPAEANISIAL